MQTFNLKSFILAASVLFSCMVFFSSCDEDDTPDIPVTVTETLATYSELSTLVSAIERASLTNLIDGAELTLFAPTNTAFDAFLLDNGFATLEEVPLEVLNNLLLNHVVDGTVRSSDLVNGYVSTAANAPGNNNISMLINIDSGVSLNGSSFVSTPDIDGTSGTIHIVDGVIAVPDVVDHAIMNGSFTNLVTAVVDQGLESTLRGEGPFTVFAPSDDALWQGTLLAPNLTEILLDHVVAGNLTSADLVDGPVATSGTDGMDSFDISIDSETGAVTISDSLGAIAVVTVADVQGSNGVVHVINNVIVL